MTAGYSRSIILNMDVASFFYCMTPHRSITRNRIPGLKKNKKRITVALTTNAAGTSVLAGRQDRLYNEPLDVAMGWAKDAWMSVSNATERNCWDRTGIIDDDLTVFSARVANL
ncbi:Aste57867_23794 [Aphanomyces stellatus]|uniref:Aste57867_23794 protein n=1 Tax=Aphanomyces stellatus TaxID=120398 RepID=A0A485LPQ9_9STRA|nr:hypothetical protein As57867_023721 [Aphanomyces stellatus]VFU00439.1 Aste57867_23794 [Aphanomyces stellatus]